MYVWIDRCKEMHFCVLQDIGPLGPLPKKGPSVLQDIVPLRDAALLPFTLIDNHAKQSNGYRWHILHLGDLFSSHNAKGVPNFLSVIVI